jgi:hypothetical protein
MQQCVRAALREVAAVERFALVRLFWAATIALACVFGGLAHSPDDNYRYSAYRECIEGVGIPAYLRLRDENDHRYCARMRTTMKHWAHNIAHAFERKFRYKRNGEVLEYGMSDKDRRSAWTGRGLVTHGLSRVHDMRDMAFNHAATLVAENYMLASVGILGIGLTVYVVAMCVVSAIVAAPEWFAHPLSRDRFLEWLSPGGLADLVVVPVRVVSFATIWLVVLYGAALLSTWFVYVLRAFKLGGFTPLFSVARPIILTDVVPHVGIADVNRIYSTASAVLATVTNPLKMGGYSGEMQYSCEDAYWWKAFTPGTNTVWRERIHDFLREAQCYVTYNFRVCDETFWVVTLYLSSWLFGFPRVGYCSALAYLVACVKAHLIARPAFNAGLPSLNNHRVLNAVTTALFTVMLAAAGLGAISAPLVMLLGGSATSWPVVLVWIAALVRSVYPIMLVYRESKTYQHPEARVDNIASTDQVDAFRATNIQYVTKMVDGFAALRAVLTIPHQFARYRPVAVLSVPKGGVPAEYHVMPVCRTYRPGVEQVLVTDRPKYWSIAEVGSITSFEYTDKQVSDARVRNVSTKTGPSPAICRRDAVEGNENLPEGPQVDYCLLNVLSSENLNTLMICMGVSEASYCNIYPVRITSSFKPQFQGPAVVNYATAVHPRELYDGDAKETLRTLSPSGSVLLRGVCTSASLDTISWMCSAFHRVTEIQWANRSVPSLSPGRNAIVSMFIDRMFVEASKYNRVRWAGGVATMSHHGRDADKRLTLIKRGTQRAGIERANEIGDALDKDADGIPVCGSFPKAEGNLTGIEELAQRLMTSGDLDDEISPEAKIVRFISLMSEGGQASYDYFVGGVKEVMLAMPWYGFADDEGMKDKVMDRLGARTALWFAQTDVSKMDASQTEWCTVAFADLAARATYFGECVGNDYDRWRDFVGGIIAQDYNVLAEYRGVRVLTEKMMRSGIRSTSDRNTFLNALMDFVAKTEECLQGRQMQDIDDDELDEIREIAWDSLGLYGGDDGISVNTNLRMKIKVCKQLGFKLTPNIVLVKPLKRFTEAESNLFAEYVDVDALPKNVGGNPDMPDDAIASFLGRMFRCGPSATGAWATEFLRRHGKHAVSVQSPFGVMSDFDLMIFQIISDYVTDGHLPRYGQLLRAEAYRMSIDILNDPLCQSYLDVASYQGGPLDPYLRNRRRSGEWELVIRMDRRRHEVETHHRQHQLRSVPPDTALRLLRNVMSCACVRGLCEGVCYDQSCGADYVARIDALTLSVTGLPDPCTVTSVTEDDVTVVREVIAKSSTGSTQHRLDVSWKAGFAAPDHYEEWMGDFESVLWSKYVLKYYDEYIDPDADVHWGDIPMLYERPARFTEGKDHAYIFGADEEYISESCLCAVDGCDKNIYDSAFDRHRRAERRKILEAGTLPTMCRQHRRAAREPLLFTDRSPRGIYKPNVCRIVQSNGQCKNLATSLYVTNLVNNSADVIPFNVVPVIVVFGCGDLITSGTYWLEVAKLYPRICFRLCDPLIHGPVVKRFAHIQNVSFFCTTLRNSYAKLKTGTDSDVRHCLHGRTTPREQIWCGDMPVAIHFLSDVRSNTGSGEEPRPTDDDKRRDMRETTKLLRAMIDNGLDVRSTFLKVSYYYTPSRRDELLPVPCDDETRIMRFPYCAPNSSEFIFAQSNVSAKDRFKFDMDSRILEAWSVGDAELRDGAHTNRTGCVCVDCRRLAAVLSDLPGPVKTFLEEFVRKHLPQALVSEPAPVTEKLPEVINPDQQLFWCSKCPQGQQPSFATKDSLHSHLREKHGGGTTVCRHCNETVQHSELREHLFTRHPKPNNDTRPPNRQPRTHTLPGRNRRPNKKFDPGAGPA